jgi:hypothetical protein
MGTAEYLRERARVLRAQANDTLSAEAARAFLARAAWLEQQAEALAAEEKGNSCSSGAPQLTLVGLPPFIQ